MPSSLRATVNTFVTTAASLYSAPPCTPVQRKPWPTRHANTTVGPRRPTLCMRRPRRPPTRNLCDRYRCSLLTVRVPTGVMTGAFLFIASKVFTVCPGTVLLGFSPAGHVRHVASLSACINKSPVPFRRTYAQRLNATSLVHDAAPAGRLHIPSQRARSGTFHFKFLNLLDNYLVIFQ